jgi:hypothetical protein
VTLLRVLPEKNNHGNPSSLKFRRRKDEGNRSADNALLCVSRSGPGSNLTVAPSGTPYISIQDALNHAAAGDTILIEPGRYTGPVVVSTALILGIDFSHEYEF